MVGHPDHGLPRQIEEGMIQLAVDLETSHRLELLLGPDLQYIRLNGTVVGGTAGLALHVIARALGSPARHLTP